MGVGSISEVEGWVEEREGKLWFEVKKAKGVASRP